MAATVALLIFAGRLTHVFSAGFTCCCASKLLGSHSFLIGPVEMGADSAGTCGQAVTVCPPPGAGGNLDNQELCGDWGDLYKVMTSVWAQWRNPQSWKTAKQVATEWVLAKEEKDETDEMKKEIQRQMAKLLTQIAFAKRHRKGYEIPGTQTMTLLQIAAVKAEKRTRCPHGIYMTIKDTVFQDQLTKDIRAKVRYSATQCEILREIRDKKIGEYCEHAGDKGKDGMDKCPKTLKGVDVMDKLCFYFGKTR